MNYSYKYFIFTAYGRAAVMKSQTRRLIRRSDNISSLQQSGRLGEASPNDRQ